MIGITCKASASYIFKFNFISSVRNISNVYTCFANLFVHKQQCYAILHKYE